MKVEIRLEEGCSEPKLILVARELTPELQALVDSITRVGPDTIPGTIDGKVTLLRPADVVRIYASGQRVLAETAAGTFALKLRLYELEAKLDGRMFLRISGSELINLRQAESFDLNRAGTICVRMKNGAETYVSRRYVSKIKQALGV